MAGACRAARLPRGPSGAPSLLVTRGALAARLPGPQAAAACQPRLLALQLQRTLSPGCIASAAMRVAAVLTRALQCDAAAAAFGPQVHADYVDCCRWLGDLVLSKSVDYKVSSGCCGC